MKYTKQIDDYYSTRIIKSIFKIAWVIVGTTTNIIWWSFSKLPKSISLLLIPLGVIFASGVVTPVVSNEEAVIIYDIPTPTEQRLKDLEGTEWSIEDILWYTELKSAEYGADTEYVKAIMNCESGFNQYIQSRHIYNFTDSKRGIYSGEQELSIGLSQINLHYHPTVTVAMAQSPEYSIDFITKRVANNQAHLWSCSKMV